MNINEFIRQHDVDYTTYLIEKTELQQVENVLGVKVGPQLSEYLLHYGYLGFESVEFYGMNSRQGMKSDMVTQTLYLHKYYAATTSYVAVGNFGEGDYILVDSEDNVLRFISEENTLANVGKKLFDYILYSFQEELK